MIVGVYGLITALIVFPYLSAAVNVGYVPCGATIPIDSIYTLDPVWALTPYRNRVEEKGSGHISFKNEYFSPNDVKLLVSETGLASKAITVFHISGSASCECFIDPRLAAMSGTIFKTARIVFLGLYNNSGAPMSECKEPTVLSVSLNNGRSTMVPLNGASSFVPSASFAVDEDVWPARVAYEGHCDLRIVVLVDRSGDIKPWYVWIPTTVYTCIVTALILPTISLRRKIPHALATLMMTMVYIGYFGCCIGLVAELVLWQSSIGRMFPFPSSVTLYCCLVILYMVYLAALVYCQKHYSILGTTTTRLLIYGMNCALCIGYWLSGYVLLGSLSIVQYVVTNGLLSWYFAYFTVHVRKVQADRSPKYSYVFIYLWFVPFSPFAPCALLYYDLFAIGKANRDRKHLEPSEKALRDAIYAYSVQMSLPFLLFQNVFGAALVATATAFHMPFAVVLFVLLFLWGLHAITSLAQYRREWRHWKRLSEGVSGSFCTSWCLSLNPITAKYLFDSSNNVNDRPSVGSSHAYSAEIPQQQQIDNYNDNGTVLHPPYSMVLTPRDDEAQSPCTPRGQGIGNVEFWPNSVER